MLGTIGFAIAVSLVLCGRENQNLRRDTGISFVFKQKCGNLEESLSSFEFTNQVFEYHDHKISLSAGIVV